MVIGDKDAEGRRTGIYSTDHTGLSKLVVILYEMILTE